MKKVEVYKSEVLGYNNFFETEQECLLAEARNRCYKYLTDIYIKREMDDEVVFHLNKDDLKNIKNTLELFAEACDLDWIKLERILIESHNEKKQFHRAQH